MVQWCGICLILRDLRFGSVFHFKSQMIARLASDVVLQILITIGNIVQL